MAKDPFDTYRIGWHTIPPSLVAMLIYIILQPGYFFGLCYDSVYQTVSSRSLQLFGLVINLHCVLYALTVILGTWFFIIIIAGVLTYGYKLMFLMYKKKLPEHMLLARWISVLLATLLLFFTAPFAIML